jgi:ABC-type multidrug transport system fused ATPase/permease subunit
MSHPASRTDTALPVADAAHVRGAAVRLIRSDARGFAALLLLTALSAGVGLVTPWLLGRIVDMVMDGRGVAAVDQMAALILACSVGQLLLSRYAGHVGFRFGQRLLARVREQFVDRALALPASVVERAGTGDLTARGTADVTGIGGIVAPDVLISAVQALLIMAAVFVLDPVLGGVGVVGLSGIWFAVRWYLRRARTAYLAQGAAGSVMAEQLSATASGARTVEALGLQQRRIDVCARVVDENIAAQLRTLYLRSVLFPATDISYVIPVTGTLLIGTVLYDNGAVSLGAVVAAALYLRQLSQPLDSILQRLEQLQSSVASLARVEGVALSGESEPDTSLVPGDRTIAIAGVRFAYDGTDVLHDVNLTIRPGERIALVGPSGAGKTTLGRLLSGAERPREGTVTVGGIPVADLAPERLRQEVVLVTQESHVFRDPLRDNLLIAAPQATDDQLYAALASVGADQWVARLPNGLETDLGPGGHHIDPSQAQQLALARVVLADPHTVILDEATALLSPRTARRTERALATVLQGRTVIAVAHRLHTAHDADRVGVMQDGRLVELGSHDELVARGGVYARLWSSWHGEATEATHMSR